MRRSFRVLTLACAASLVALALPLFAADGGKKGTASDNEFDAAWHFDDRPAELKALVGKPMPKLSLGKWYKGKELKADDMRGKILVVDIWATWCGPCIRAIPHNNELAKKYADKGVRVLGVCSSDNGQDKMEATADARGIEYYLADDPTLATEKAWKIAFYPSYFVVDRQGIVRAAGLTPAGVDKVVEALLQEQPPK